MITNGSGKWQTVRRMRARPSTTEGMVLIAIDSAATKHVLNDHRMC